MLKNLEGISGKDILVNRVMMWTIIEVINLKYFFEYHKEL